MFVLLFTYPLSLVADFLNELLLLDFSLVSEDPKDLVSLILESWLPAVLCLLAQSGSGLGWGAGGGRSGLKAY